MNLFFENIFSVFSSLNPILFIFAYFSMTLAYTSAQKEQMGKKIAIFSAFILVFFLLTGSWIFDFLGLSFQAFYITGAILLFFSGLELLTSPNPLEESVSLEKKKDLTLIPFVIPLVVNPKSVALMCVYNEHLNGFRDCVYLFFCIWLAIAILYGIFLGFLKIMENLHPKLFFFGYRLSGLFFISLGVQFFLKGLQLFGLRLSF